MASSDIEIANAALTKLGEARILAFTDDSKPARTLNAIYGRLRDAELSRCRWKFAIKRDTLPALATAPAWGFTYAYQLPSDYLSLVQVNDYYLAPRTPQAPLWTIESGQLLTDLQAPLRIRYVRRPDSSGAFHPLFVEALACRLAAEAAEALTQSSTKREAMLKDYREAVLEAARVDAMEVPPDVLPWGSWLESREGPGMSLHPSADEVPPGLSGFSVV